MAKRTKADWWYAYPDDRNRLIEEARELLAVAAKESKMRDYAGYPEWSRAARRWLKETKP